MRLPLWTKALDSGVNTSTVSALNKAVGTAPACLRLLFYALPPTPGPRHLFERQEQLDQSVPLNARCDFAIRGGASDLRGGNDLHVTLVHWTARYGDTRREWGTSFRSKSHYGENRVRSGTAKRQKTAKEKLWRVLG